MNSNWKKSAIASLALLMLAGGTTTAFADRGSKDKDDDHKGKDKDEIKINIDFEDEEELKWALEHIMRLASKGVFNGYSDGTFKPNQKISRIETLTAAVRLMGLREQAESAAEMGAELNFRDADKIEKKYPWAVGYVSVAVKNDLFTETETDVQPEKEATRLWAATILIKALKLEDEAKALNGTKLDFKDAKNIPAGSVGYVALAIQKGIITGYGDKTFRPNQPVTRAELAALLDRTDSEMPNHDAHAIEGKLKAAPAAGKITVVKADNTEVTLDVAPNVFIFKNDKKSALTDLAANDQVLVRTYQNKVVFIEVTAPAPVVVAFTETGVLNGFTLNAQNKLSTVSILKAGQATAVVYNVDANATINGIPVQGQNVEVKGENNIVKSITIK
ncbi:S-layer homology domain-containing protein [Paenibacillus sp. GCM10023252]|uniref:S-layer homology domain-containing protein n=1 Tax=Paenibacillus sp. GCM10023252 TaxID=3252649 RepID=UPI00361F4FF4